MKKLISFVLTAAMLFGMTTAFAIDEGEARTVIGADISEAQKASVYKTFGIEPGDVKELTVTNAEEREYLDGVVDTSLIGTHSISCIYIKILAAGKGLDVSTSNISWCTKEMYRNALATAGIDDAKVIVTSPIQGISGTAALTGVYKAYEDITGTKLDTVAKQAGTQELVTTAELADEIGSADAVMIVNELKGILSETKKMSDDELRAEIRKIADDNNVALSDEEIDSLISLTRQLEKLDPEQLKAKVEEFQSMARKFAGAKDKISKFAASFGEFVQSVGSFLSDLFGGSSKG
ncbi:MAG: DUF1002 domain-containing protein [Oscillospiraceae bacterium]|jgi:uncharacterized protein YpuA (DUF1002 family)